MKRVSFFVIIFFLMLFPTFVKAETSQEMLDKLPSYQRDGKDYLDINAVNPNEIPSKYCEVMYDGHESCDLFDHYLRLIFKNKKIENFDKFALGYYYELKDDKVVVTYCPDSNKVSLDCLTKEFYVEWKSFDNKNEVIEMSNEINKNEYMVFGGSLLNLAYNNDNFSYYDYLNENFAKENYDVILSIYPEFKNIIEEYIDYRFVLVTGPSGGGPGDYNCGAMVGIFKGNTLVNVEYVDFNVKSVLFVPEHKNNDLIKSAEKLLKESYKKNKDFTIENSDVYQEYLRNYSDGIVEHLSLDKYIKIDENRKLNIEDITLKIGNSSLEMFLVGVDKDEYKEMFVKSKDKKTGVNIVAKGTDIPSDVRVIVEDLSDNNEIKESGKDKKIDIKKAYDISLKRLYDNSLINETPFGVEVFIPVEDYKENDEVQVYFIKDNKVQEEQIKGVVVKKDDKLYVKFIANHFSTYAVGEQVVENTVTDVPKTNDSIQIFLLLIILSVAGLFSIYAYKFRYN